jgi:hypothetical protein
MFRTCPDRPWTHPASCTMRTGSFPGVKSGRGVTLTPHSLLVAKSKKQGRAIPLLSVRAFVACKRVFLVFIDKCNLLAINLRNQRKSFVIAVSNCDFHRKCLH